jgi:hypothetical protein
VLRGPDAVVVSGPNARSVNALGASVAQLKSMPPSTRGDWPVM